MRRGLTEPLNNCFMCNNPFDQKPLIEEDGEKSGSPLSDFKRGFSLFCKILNDVHSCDSELLTKFAESYENAETAKEVDLAMGARGKCGVFELPCCSLCYDTLVTILGLQKAIEENQVTQLDHVKNLKEILKSSSDSEDVSYNDEDFWNTIRRQLVACLTPAISFSNGDNDDSNEFLGSIDNDECPIPTPTSSIYTSISVISDHLVETNVVPGQATLISKAADVGQASLKRKQRFDNIRQEDEPISPKPKVVKSPVKPVVTHAGKPVVKPCFVHLERLDLKKITHIDEVRVNQSSHCELDEENSGKVFRVFYLVGENLVMFHYTIAKFTSDGFYCQEKNCKQVIKGTDYNSFQQLRYHILDDHKNSQYSMQSRQCPLCREKCSNGPNFRDHLLRNHKRELKFVCEACWKPFPEKGTFVHNDNTTQVEKHMWTHKNANEVLEASEEMKLRKMKGGKEYNFLLQKLRQRAKQEGEHNSQSSQIPLLAKEVLLDKSEFEDEEGVNEDGLSNETLFGENDDVDYCEIEQNLKMKPLSDKIKRRSRCNDFYTVGGKHLLFQQTFVRYSPLGFQCLEGGSCFHTVSGTDYYSFQEIRYHILDDHEGSEYPRIPRSCIVCKQKYPNGTLLRRHLLSEHASCMELLCESCWKPFPPDVGLKNSTAVFQSHTASHKCDKEKAVDEIVENLMKQYGTTKYNIKMQVLRKKVKKSGKKLTPRTMLAVKLLKHSDIIMKDEQVDTLKEDETEIYFPEEYDNDNSEFEGITKPEEDPSQLKVSGELSFFKNCQRLAKNRRYKGIKNLNHANSRPRCTSSLFWLVGEELLLFQNTTIHFSSDEFKCLEKNCGRIVKRGEDSELSFTEIGNHVNEDHKSRTNYGSIRRNCPVCQATLKDGYSLRIHLFQVHFCPAICTICWKPLNPNNSNFAAIHMWTHKSVQERNAVIEAGGKDLDLVRARRILRHKLGKKKGRINNERKCERRKGSTKMGTKAKLVLKTEEDLRLHVHRPEADDLDPAKLGARRSKQKAAIVIRNSLKEASGSEGEENNSDLGNTSSAAFRKKRDDGEFEPNETSMDEGEAEDEVESSSEYEMNDNESSVKGGKIATGDKQRKLPRCKRMFPESRERNGGFYLEHVESKIYVLKDDLLMYLFSLFKLSHGEIQCLDGDCDKKVGSFEDDAIHQMKTHIKLCHKDRNASRSCKICGDEVEDGIQFRRHQFLTHSISPSTYLCEICFKPVTVGDSRFQQFHTIHTMSHLNDKELQAALGNKKNKDSLLEKIQAAKMGQEEEYMEGGFKCQLCGKEFSYEFHLKKHLVTHQPASMRKQFECSYCQIQLLSQGSLQTHIERRHRPDLQKKFRDCPICNRRFHYRDGDRFRSHVRAHSNEKPFVCEICGKGFSCKQLMKGHIESHNEARDYQCEYCEKNYKNKKHLERHKRTVHKEKLEDV